MRRSLGIRARSVSHEYSRAIAADARRGHFVLGSVLREPLLATLVSDCRRLVGRRYVVVLWLAHGSLPFDRPAVAHVPFALQMAVPSIVLIEIFVLMVAAFLLTRKRVIPDMAARAPDRRLAFRETILVLVYAALGQVGGLDPGPGAGLPPFSFHIAGSVFGCTVTPQRAEVWVWAFYNFLVFAVAPYVYFRRRYTSTELNLRSTNRRNDALLIFVVLTIESAFELAAFDENICT